MFPRLVRDRDYEIEEKNNIVSLTEEGVQRVEQMLGVDNLYDDTHLQLNHRVKQALKAHTLMKKRSRLYCEKWYCKNC